MKRDMNLIRQLLLDLEAFPQGPGVVSHRSAKCFEIAGYEADQIDYHLDLISESGFIDDGGMRVMEGIGFRRLTWGGHDFLDSVRNPEVWAKTKKGAEAAGGFTIDLLKALAKGLLKKQIADHTGVTLDL